MNIPSEKLQSDLIQLATVMKRFGWKPASPDSLELDLKNEGKIDLNKVFGNAHAAITLTLVEAGDVGDFMVSYDADLDDQESKQLFDQDTNVYFNENSPAQPAELIAGAKNIDADVGSKCTGLSRSSSDFDRPIGKKAWNDPSF